MGILSALTGGGGGGSSSTSVSGYAALPPAVQKSLGRLNTGASIFASPFNKNGTINQANIDRFAPLAQTADETAAFDQIRQGFTPDQAQLTSDINMQMNPYLDSVISEVNRQGQGANSVLQQNLNTAGQFGSNRGVLGANDIDLSRQNQIGGLLSQQYNQSLNNALTTLPALRGADAQGLLGIGNFQRGITAQTNQAPITALQTQAGILSGLGAGFNSSSQTQTTGASGGGGLFSGLGGIGSLAQGASALAPILGFSDRQLKENIEPYAIENGHQTYTYNYKGTDKKYIGVMAQDVAEYMPEAVKNVDGFLSVNYDMLGVNMREVE